MALKLKGKAQTSVEKKQAGKTMLEDHKEEEVGGKLLSVEPLDEVGIEASQTLNQGNYNSVRIGVSLKLHCARGDINKTFEFAKDWVDTKMGDLLKELED